MTSLPSPSPPPTSLFAEINLATRTQHLVLNRLIAARLPLALPPHASDPELLGRGILPFAHVILTFENAWNNLPPASGSNPHLRPSLLQYLETLRPKGLSRAARFHADLSHIEKKSQRFSSRHQQHPLTSRLASPSESLSTTHIHMGPHVLLAYAWVFYMAIFSGGRWIRSQFKNVDPSFWTEPHLSQQQPNRRLDLDEKSLANISPPGFSFLCFDADTQDGELIKTAFKARLEAAEGLLSSQERQEVVEEAVFLFELCIGIVRRLDREVWMRKVRGGLFAMVVAASVLVFLASLMRHAFWT